MRRRKNLRVGFILFRWARLSAFCFLLYKKATLSGGFSNMPSIWPQVASLTLGARGPASPCSPFGLWPQTRIRLWLSNPNAGKAVCPLTGYKKATLSGGFSNMPSIGFEPMTFPMSRERATPAPTGLKSGKEVGCLTELPFYYSKSSF